MRKKLLSLFVSVLMLCQLLPAAQITTFAESKYGVNARYVIKYFADEACTQQITSIGETDGIFYVQLSVGKIDAAGMQFCLGYNPEAARLVSFTATEPDGSPAPVANRDRIEVTETDEYMSIMRPVPGYPITNSGLLGFKAYFDNILPAGKNINSGLTINQTEGYIYLVLNDMATSNDIDVDADTPYLLFKFEGLGGTQPKNFNMTNYTSQDSRHYSYVMDLDPDVDIDIGWPIDFVCSPFTIGDSRDQLGAPAPVVSTTNSRQITWPAVTGATKYLVTVKSGEPGSEIATTVVEQDINGATSYVIPDSVIPYGRATVEIYAEGDPVTTRRSDAGTAVTSINITLGAPVIRWNASDSKTVEWSAMPNADKYLVDVKKNGVSVSGSPFEESSLSKDLSALMLAPQTGSVNTYTVTVKAASNSAYCATSIDSNMLSRAVAGKVTRPINLQWNESTKTASWEKGDAADQVSGYAVKLFKNGNEVANFNLSSGNTQQSMAAAIEANGPGSYRFTVVAKGAYSSAIGGMFEDSDSAESGELITSMNLQKPVITFGDDKKVTWTDPNEAGTVLKYIVTLEGPSGTPEVKEFLANQDKEWDLSGRNSGGSLYMPDAGNYKVTVKAVGSNHYYNDSEEFVIKHFAQPLPVPATAAWSAGNNVFNAEWTMGSTTGVGYYQVALYLNGILVADSIDTVSSSVNTYDFNNKAKRFAGNYTFTVQAMPAHGNNDYSASEALQSASKTFTPDTVSGLTNIKLFKTYDNGTFSDEVTGAAPVRAGENVYAVIYLNTQSAPFAITTLAVPFKYDTTMFEVVDANNDAVASGDIQTFDINSGVIAGDIATAGPNGSLSVQSQGSRIDASTGLVVAILANTGAAYNCSAEVSVYAVKLRAKAVGSSDFGIAKAGVNAFNSGEYDATSYGGVQAAIGTLGVSELKYIDDTQTVSVTTQIGQLAKPDKPTWSNATIQWNQVDNASGYEVRLYREGTLVDTFDAAANELSLDLANDMATPGKYTVVVVAKGDSISFINSDPSDASDEFTVQLPQRPNNNNNQNYRPGSSSRPNVNAGSNYITFTDIQEHWGKEAVEYLANRGIINGYGDGTYLPDWGITRAEIAKLLVLALGYDVSNGGRVYEDTANHWAKDYIGVATEYGIVDGIGDNLYAPDVIVTREQLATMLYRISGSVPAPEKSAFADADKISGYAVDGVDYVAYNKYMIGYEDGTFAPGQSATRAEVATVIYRLMNAGFFSR